jgi:hypothetical protein
MTVAKEQTHTRFPVELSSCRESESFGFQADTMD